MDGDVSTTPRRKAAQVTKVKVVASRYAQSIQKSNLEAKAGASWRSNATSSSSNAAPTRVSGFSRSTTSRAAAPARGGVTPVPSTPAISTTIATSNSNGRSTGGSSTDGSTGGSISISEKLRLYRANKASQKPSAGGVTSTTTARASRSTPVATAAADPLRTVPRPTLPERITPPTEKASSKPPARAPPAGASTPKKRRATTPSTTPSTVPGGRALKRQAPTPSLASNVPTKTISAATSAVVRVPSASTEEELESLECLYLQLCLTEAKAAEAFHRQELNAERQIVTAWNILQSKLQLLHDTSIRLDRELQVRNLEEHLQDQADPFVRLASRISSFNDDLSVVSRSLEASLQRMPTPGVVCSPQELKRQLDSLTVTLQTFQRQVNSDGMGSTVADGLAFTQDMEVSTEQISSLLLQVGHLLEEIQLEINTETSLKAHSIQDARVDKSMDTTDWL